MQGQRGIIGSLPDILEFDHGSTSGSAIMDQQVCWNIMANPAENRLADFMISPNHINSIDQERHNLSGWSLGEPSSSGASNEGNLEEQKSERPWSASASGCVLGGGPRLEDRGYEAANILSLNRVNANSQFVQSSNSSAIPQNLNLNAGFVGHVDLESSKSGRADNERTPGASGSDTFRHPQGSGGFIMEGNDGRAGSSSDNGRPSCKRKAVEGQSSMSESPGFFQCSENTAWSAGHDAGSSLSMSAPLEQVNPRLGLGFRGLASDSIPASQRNFRLRVNPSNQDSISPHLSSSASAFRRSNVASSSSHPSSRLPADHSLDFRSFPVLDGNTSQSQPLPVPALPQNVQPFRWNVSSSSRSGGSSSSITLGNREEGNSRSASRNLWEHPMFVPTTELRTSVRNPTSRSVASGPTVVPGTLASTSRTGSSSGVQPLPAPTWASQPNPPSRSSRRLAEYVRRSLFSSANAESGGQSSANPLHSGLPGTPADAIISSNQGNHRSYPRSASWLERQGDSVPGFPYPLRTLAAGEGRSRLLVSEIRNVLDLMRRGENLRFEDVMILDQSVFFGVPDIHDRHRDMRLDVDNMSYEELLALEERIGNVNTGLSEESISKQLKQRKYSPAQQKSDVEAEPCCVCQEEYNDGENIGTLDCGHDYHTDCIKQWLKLKNWCPICKTTGLATS